MAKNRPIRPNSLTSRSRVGHKLDLDRPVVTPSFFSVNAPTIWSTFYQNTLNNQTINTLIKTDGHRLKSEKDKNWKLKSFLSKHFLNNQLTTQVHYVVTHGKREFIKDFEFGKDGV